jgi:pyridoxal 5-phosphate dependent beta-lyase
MMQPVTPQPVTLQPVNPQPVTPPVDGLRSTLPHPQLGRAWRAARLPTDVVHLDSAAAARSSRATLNAIAGHLRREAETGGYVAAVEASETIERGRGQLAALLGRRAEDVAFAESAFAAITALMSAWPLPPDARVVVSPGEYGPNLALFAAYGLAVQVAPVADAVGHLDVDALARRLATDPPALVHLCAVGAHRGIVQPVAEVVAAGRSAGVPVVVDAAQAVGPVDCRIDADAIYGTSRKWLAGPRGVGFLAVAPALADRLRPAVDRGGPGVSGLESREAFVAGRVGLAVAVGELVAAGPEPVRQRLAAIGALSRAVLDGVGGWAVVEPADEPSATTTLRPPPGWDDARVARACRRLLTEHRIVVTYAGPDRAPAEVDAATMRVSPHVDVTEDQITALADALPLL